MGDIADYYIDQMWDYDDCDEPQEDYDYFELKEAYEKGEKVWQTNNGEEKSLQEMTLNHLQNCKKLLLRTRPDSQILEFITIEIDKR